MKNRRKLIAIARGQPFVSLDNRLALVLKSKNARSLSHHRYHRDYRSGRGTRFVATIFLLHVCRVRLLVLVGVFAFLIHFYWTKIGVSEIWNTARWSSMRSSLYNTVRRISRPNASKTAATEQPYYDEDRYSYSSQHAKSGSVVDSYITPSSPYVSNPVPTISYTDRDRMGYATKIGQPIESTKIYSMHEYDTHSYAPSAGIDKQRF